MTATLAVMVFHLLTWQRHFRRQGGSGGVSDRSCPCMSFCMCNGLVFSLIVVREWDDMSGRIWRDLFFQHIAHQSNIMTIQMGCSEGPKFCMFLPFFVSLSFIITFLKSFANASTTLLPTHPWPTYKGIGGSKVISLSHITSSATIYGSSLTFQHLIVIPEVTWFFHQWY